MDHSSLIALSANGSHLAFYNNDILKIWNTFSNTLENQVNISEYVSNNIISMKFSPLSETDEVSKYKNVDASSSNAIALGTDGGIFFIYYPKTQSVSNEFSHNANGQVCIQWTSPNHIVSVGSKVLKKWKVSNAKQSYEIGVTDGNCVCIIGPDSYVVGGAKLEFTKRVKNSADKAIENYVVSAQKNAITQLYPITFDDEKEAKYFLSVAEGDNFIYAWSVTTRQSVACFLAKSAVTNVHVITSSEKRQNIVEIIAITDRGFVQYFKHHFNGAKGGVPLEPAGGLRIAKPSDGLKRQVMPILTGRFLGRRLLFAYGSKDHFLCEQIDVDDFSSTVRKLIRNPPKQQIEERTKSEKGRHIAARQAEVHLMPTQVAPSKSQMTTKEDATRAFSEEEASLKERVAKEALTARGSMSDAPLSNYSHLLIQALQSGNLSMLDELLADEANEDVMQNTVKLLPMPQVIAFVKYLQEVMLSAPEKDGNLLRWLRTILVHHMGFLSCVKGREQMFESVMAVLNARESTIKTIVRVHSRLDLLIEQRNCFVKQKEVGQHHKVNSAVATYQNDYDSSSDDDLVDDRLQEREGGGVSESSEVWDEWDENEAESDDETSKKSRKRPREERIEENGEINEEMDDESCVDLEDDESGSLMSD